MRNRTPCELDSIVDINWKNTFMIRIRYWYLVIICLLYFLSTASKCLLVLNRWQLKLQLYSYGGICFQIPEWTSRESCSCHPFPISKSYLLYQFPSRSQLSKYIHHIHDIDHWYKNNTFRKQEASSRILFCSITRFPDSQGCRLHILVLSYVLYNN